MGNIYVKDRITWMELFCKEKLRIGSKFEPLYDMNLNPSRKFISNGQPGQPGIPRVIIS